MKLAAPISLLFLLIFAVGCKDEAEKEKPKVIYDASKEKLTPKIDSSKIEISDLPIHLKGSNFLIHPEGDIRVYDGSSKSSYGSANADRVSFTISNTSENEITGFLRNVKFQEIGKDTITSLTDKRILIQSITLVKTAKKGVLVYNLMDMDTNKDGNLDTNDIKTLYISDTNGARFTKLSTDFQELIDWSVIDVQNRLYFRTIEDTNKNGQFDKNDVLHYNYLNLNDKEWNIKSYNPL